MWVRLPRRLLAAPRISTLEQERPLESFSMLTSWKVSRTPQFSTDKTFNVIPVISTEYQRDGLYFCPLLQRFMFYKYIKHYIRFKNKNKRRLQSPHQSQERPNLFVWVKSLICSCYFYFYLSWNNKYLSKRLSLFWYVFVFRENVGPKCSTICFDLLYFHYIHISSIL